MNTLESIFTPEQISDLFLTYAYAENMGNDPQAALVAVISPLLPQVDLLTGRNNDAGALAVVVAEAFRENLSVR